MSEITIEPESGTNLQPIKIGILETLRLVKLSYQNPLQHAQELQSRFGNVVMQKLGRQKFVNIYGADAHQLALVNEGQLFSNKKAWDLIIGRIFPNGLMLRDGDDHRYHRRLMQAGFKKKVMQNYLLKMVPQIESAICDWPVKHGKPITVYPLFKRMTLDLAATIFLGMSLGKDANRISAAFETTVAASMPKLPVAFPGTVLWRGLRARKTMCAYFQSQIPSKRSGAGTDMFSLLCQATDEVGNRYTDQEVVDHIIFLMMAAHDTTTSALTSMTYALGRYPEWQQRLFEEVQQCNTSQLRYQDLDQLEQLEWVMKEALRMYPPLSTLPKYSLKAFEFEGQMVPANALVTSYPIHTHYCDAYWSAPLQFDPQRFSDARAEHKNHPYCWVPFSGGAHMCIGLHFAVMQIKLVLFEMLRRYRWSVPQGYTMPVQQSPISKPRDGLPVYFEARH